MKGGCVRFCYYAEVNALSFRRKGNSFFPQDTD